MALAGIRDAEAPSTVLSAPINVASKKKAAAKTTRVVRTTTAARPGAASGSGSLKALLQSEREKTQLVASSRHSHFGGTLLVSGPGGKESYVSASDYLAKKSKAASAAGGRGGARGSAASGDVAPSVGQPMRRKNKKAEVFVGSGKSTAMHSGASAALSRDAAGPTSRAARIALDSFCSQFLRDCYGPVMKNLKDEFRKESHRLEDGDRTLFFRIVWFFHQWWRVRRENDPEAKKKKEKPEKEVKGKKAGDGAGVEDESVDGGSSATNNIIFTMDVFMFNLVTNSTDEFFEHKKPAALAQTVALYTEMIHMLHAMYESHDSTERMMALGLMDRLFYASEPIDRLPRLLSRWTPGLYSREYLCDLVECAHVTWKLLDANAARCAELMSPENERERKNDVLERMTLSAFEFDKDHYFMRKFVSNHIVFMYTQLLSQYDVNAAHVNRHVAAYFIRLCKFPIKSGSGGEDMGEFDDALGKNELAAKPATFEPMLYNIGLFTVLDKVLNDPAIRDKEDYEALLMFASSFMKRFARAAEANPMLYVEALFKHPVPHRFCELATNMYVNEELRMIAVRELLLEDQRRYEQEGGDDEDDEAIKEGVEGAGEEEAAAGYDDDDEEELEFNGDDDDDDLPILKKRRRKARKSRRSKSKKNASADEKDSDEPDDANEAEFGGENDAEDSDAKDDGPSEEREQRSKDSTLTASDANEESDAAGVPEEGVATTVEAADKSEKLSGKKRIRKYLEKEDEDSDDDDFFGSAAPAKATKRVIFDDDDDDD